MRPLVALGLQQAALPARVQVYDLPASADWKRTCLAFVREHRQDPLWDGAVVLTAWFFFPVPKSYPMQVHRAVAAGELVLVIVAPDTE